MLLFGTAFAQGPDVRVELAGKRVILKEGKETFVPADKAGPGEVIQYEAVYRNAGSDVAQRVAATVPIPQGMTLQANTAQPAAAEGSLDGKNFSPLPLMREVRNEAGAVENEPVPLAEYRALRWTLPELAPGKSTTVAVRAQIVTNTPAH
jgi:uncharacterized repeat protein (TIGR01451 family)